MITKEILWSAGRRVRVDDVIQEYCKHKLDQECDPIVASWREFEIQSGSGKVLVTPAGEKLFKGLPSLAKDFRNFRVVVDSADLREELQRLSLAGSAYSVYQLGLSASTSEIAVKRLLSSSRERDLQPVLIKNQLLDELATRFMPSYFKVVKYYGMVTIFDQDFNHYTSYIIMERIFGPTLAEFVTTAQIYNRKFWGGVINVADRTRQQFEDIVQKYTNIPPITLDMWNRKNQILDFAKPVGDVPFTMYAFDL